MLKCFFCFRSEPWQPDHQMFFDHTKKVWICSDCSRREGGFILKPGYKTTEYWLVVIALLIPLINKVCGLNLDVKLITDGFMSVVALVAYVVSRTYVKGKTTS